MQLQKAMLDPEAYFHSPKEVVKNTLFTREEKIKILKNWANQICEEETAEEENMQGPEHGSLELVMRALLELAQKR